MIDAATRERSERTYQLAKACKARGYDLQELVKRPDEELRVLLKQVAAEAGL